MYETIEQVREWNTEARVYESTAEMVGRVLQCSRQAFGFNPDIFWSNSWLGREGLSSWADVERAVNSDWPEGIRLFEETLAQVEQVDLPRPVSRKRKLHWSEDCGDDLCHDRLRGGQAFWRESRRQAATGPVVMTIIADIGTLAGHHAQEIFWRGAAAIALTHLLEESGYRIELWGASNAYRTRLSAFDAVCLKRSTGPVDISSLVNASSSWFFRTVVFGSRCSGRIPNLVGGSMPLSGCDRLDLISGDANRIVVDEIYDQRAAVKFIKSTINALCLQTA